MKNLLGGEAAVNGDSGAEYYFRYINGDDTGIEDIVRAL